MSLPILITGAAQRIGLAIVEDLVAQGQPVILTYRTRHPIVDTLIAKGVTCLYADFSSDEATHTFIADLKSHLSQNGIKGLRAVIHNASSWDCEANNPDYSALFDDMMRIHAKVPYLLNLALIDLLSQSEQADIIHMTDYIVETGSPKHLAYAASKAALENLMKSFAAKLAPKIKVNAIAPALIIFNQGDSEEYKAKTLKKSLMGIEPGCSAITQAVNLLLESNYITGRTLPVDGGRHLK